MKKTIVILLVVVTLFACFSACTPQQPDKPEETKAQATAAATEGPEEVTTDDSFIPNLPEGEKFPGDFNILCEGNFWATDSMLYKEEASDDPVDNGVWLRVDKIKEQFDTDIMVTPSADTATDLKRSVNSGDKAFDAVCARMTVIVANASNGELMDLYEVDGLDLTKGYWDQSANKELSIGGKLYYTVGDIITVEDMCTWTMMFNKKLADVHDFENLYNVVKEGRWTFDYFYSLLKDDLSHDNGDQEWDYQDTYAFSTHRDMAYGFYYAAGLSFVAKDENDIPYIDATNSEKAQLVLEYALKVMRKDNLTLDAHKWTHVDPWATRLTEAAFREDRAYFYAEVLSTIISLREMDTDFGILPMPKYNQEQPEYTTFVNPAASLIAVPIYWQPVDNARRSGVILEAMAYYGHEYIVPEFIEKAIKSKGARDVESIDMLEIILKNRHYDLGLINNWGNIATGFSDLVFNNKSDYASVFKKGETRAKRQIEKFLEKMK